MDAKDLDKERGKVLRRLRKKAGFAGEALAAAISTEEKSFSTSTIYAYERGDVALSRENAGIFADVLGVSVAELMLQQEEAPALPHESITFEFEPQDRVNRSLLKQKLQLEVRVTDPAGEKVRELGWQLERKAGSPSLSIVGAEGTNPMMLSIEVDGQELRQESDPLDFRKATTDVHVFEELLKKKDAIAYLSFRLPVSTEELRRVFVSDSHTAQMSADDAVLEISDFLSRRSSQRIVSIWATSDYSLAELLNEFIPAVEGGYQQDLVATLICMSLFKNHEVACEFVDRLVQRADSVERRCTAFYLQGRQRYYTRRYAEAAELFSACVQIAQRLQVAARIAQCKVYLARLAQNATEEFSVGDPKTLAREAESIATAIGRKDIELLAVRVLLEHYIKIEEDYASAIQLSDQLLENASHYRRLGGEAKNIINSVFLFLATAYRREGTDGIRRKAELLLRERIALDISQRDTAMAWYLLADNSVDRIIDTAILYRGSGSEHIEVSPQSKLQACLDEALRCCSRSDEGLRNCGDAAASQKLNDRQTLLSQHWLQRAERPQNLGASKVTRHQSLSLFLCGVSLRESDVVWEGESLDAGQVEEAVWTMLALYTETPPESQEFRKQVRKFQTDGVIFGLCARTCNHLTVRLFKTIGESRYQSFGWITSEFYFSKIHDSLKFTLDAAEVGSSQVEKLAELKERFGATVKTIAPVLLSGPDRMVPSILNQSSTPALNIALEWMLELASSPHQSGK